jgi:hypothetical protein
MVKQLNLFCQPSLNVGKSVKEQMAKTAKERSNLSTNGGRLSTTEIISGALNNVFPHVLRAARDAGETVYRKLSLKVHQDGNGSLATTEFCLDGPTLGQDRMVMFAGTATDTQGDITGSERIYCAGGLVSPVAAGSQTIVFAVKNVADAAGIQVGDDIRLTDKLTPASTSGNVEYHTVATKSVSGLQVTITTENLIANSYAAYSAGSGGKVGVICPAGETKASHGAIVKTSAAGVFDNTTYPILFNNMGADEHEITITFTDATNFTAVSDRFGALATGNRNTDYEPLHPTWNKPLLTIEYEAWGGTWAAGNTLVIPLHACASFVWEKRIVPAGCAPLSNNRIILVNRSEGV